MYKNVQQLWLIHSSIERAANQIVSLQQCTTSYLSKFKFFFKSHRSPSMYTVRLGEFDRHRYEGREQTLQVERIITHPHHDYPIKRNNDLALVKLKTPANLTRWVGTVCLPTVADYLHKDLRCYATGKFGHERVQ